MKKIVIAIFLLVFTIVAFAQNVELQIRDLENTEHQAMMVQDTATLSTLLAKDIIVTTPANKVVQGRDKVFAMKSAGAKFLSFEREVEQIIIKGDVAISMGHETVITLDNEKRHIVSKRRYTNIWLRQNGAWRLTARHASEICHP